MDALDRMTARMVMNERKKAATSQQLYSPLNVSYIAEQDVFLPSRAFGSVPDTHGTGSRIVVIRQGAIGREISF